jgi:hypothetical protein
MQFYHQIKPKLGRWQRYTIAVDAQPDFFEKVFAAARVALLNGTPAPLELNLGFAYCNPVDNFNKKTGRELAQTRIKPYFFNFEKFVMEYPDKNSFLFRNELDQLYLEVVQYRDSGKFRIYSIRQY